PFSAVNFHLKGFLFYIQEQYEQAITYYKKSLELKPDSYMSLPEYGRALILLGRHQEALDFFKQLPFPEDNLLKVGGEVMALATHSPEQAMQGIQTLELALEGPEMDQALNLLIFCYTILGDHEKALDLLAKAIEIKLPLVVYTQIDPMLKPLHPLSRFQQLTKQIFGAYSGQELPKRKYKKSLLDSDDLERYKQQLTQLMEEEKPFLNPELTLRDLATQLNLPANYLSQLLNEGFDQNFSEFVNTYRVEAFKTKVAKPDFQHLTILGLAYDSGFNSKTVFNTFFKKVMGKTPAAYRKEVVP
ncbi:MAG: AraC family transcriptional regulator, partial [Bacteroidota bacterium]